MTDTDQIPTATTRAPDRAPPHNQAAEAALLGAMLLTRQLGDTTPIDCAGHLTPDDFYLPAHRDIYLAIRDLHDQDQAVDVVTVADILNRRQQLDDAGGPNALIAMQAATPATSNAPRYARIISELSLLRRLIHTGADIVDIGYTQPDDPHTAVAAVIDQLLEFTERHDQTPGIGDSVDRWLNIIDLRNAGEATGIPTGLIDLDKLIGGLQPGQLIVICGRPAMGKSALAGQIARNIALHPTDPRPVVFASIEMTDIELLDRFGSNVTGIDMQTIRTGRLSERDQRSLATAAVDIALSPLHIVDDPDLRPADLVTLGKTHAVNDGNGVVIVDYLQLIRSIRNRDNRQVEVSELSGALKRVAKALHCPVIALSQLNRALEARQDKRPTLPDLRESGSIEQDADIVIGAYREDVYHERDTEWRPTNTIEAIVLKQRQGPRGTATLGWLPHTMRITNLARRHDTQQEI